MMQNNRNKILLVDDNLFFLSLLDEAFKRTGVECVMAASAKEAITILQTYTPDIILSDYEMPEMNGIEFRKYLMEQPRHKDIPFVFLTHVTDKDLVTEGLDLQAIDYIVKDTPINVVISKLNNILYTVQKQRELSTLEVTNAAKSLNVKSIPVKIPGVNGFGLDFWHQSFHNIPGGDFIDFIQISDRHTFVVLGDIMGKKWMAWYFTFGFLSYVRSAVRFAAMNGDLSTASIMQKVNSIVCADDVMNDMLSSLSLLLIDTETSTITYSGAGDLPMLWFSTATGEIKQVTSSGLLLGMFADGGYNEQQIILNKSDQLFIFTDGMIDFAAASGVKSDYNLFAETLRTWLSGGATFAHMKNDLFTQSPEKSVDDRSIINIYRN